LGAVHSYIADVTKEEERDRAYSLYGAVFGVAFILRSGDLGFLFRRGVAVPFLAAAAIEVVTIPIAVF
jgi:DHA1 family tetracycline resistance protein-like MFS transporter